MLLPVFENHASKILNFESFELENLEFQTQFYLNKMQTLEGEPDLLKNHKSRSFFRIIGVFSIYFENNYLRIAQEGFDSDEKPILYDIVSQKLPLFEWITLNLKISQNGSYDIKLLNQDEVLLK